jgi:arylsulfatase A-like enzyme
VQSTLGDELKASGRGGKVIGISLKDRAAILPAGHSADAAYWFDAPSGRFITSNFYMAALPGWLDDVNKGKPADKYAGLEWLKHKMPASGRPLNEEVEATPFGNELIQLVALRALGAERLGTTNGKTDVLTVSYSSNDYVGHRYGPDSEEVHDTALRVDKLIGELLQSAEMQAGTGNVVAFLTADHGVAPLPEDSLKRKMPAGRLDPEQIKTTLNLVLGAKFGGSHWVSYMSEAGVYLDLNTVGAQKVSREAVEEAAAAALRSLPHIARVYTRTQLQSGAVPLDRMGTAIRNGFYPARSGDVFFITDAYWIQTATGTTHGTPYDYDSHVPLLLWGPGIKAGRYNADVAPTDIAPTLATLLDVETPSGSVGRVLTEILK